MNEEEKRLRNRKIISWDYEVKANDLRALELLPTVNKIIGIPFEAIINKDAVKKDQCEDCTFKRAITEILNVLALCKLVKKVEENEENGTKGYRIKVE